MVGLNVLLAIALALAIWFRHSQGNESGGERIREASTVAVLTRVRAFSRLETTQFHMERVIALTHEQERLFGLVHAEDKLLLVAAADIAAGVDLSRLGAGDLVIDHELHSIEVRLPACEVFHVEIDEAHTFVYARDTDALAERHETLESEARQRAVSSLREAAIAAGVLRTAEAQARRTLEQLLLSLGYQHVTFSSRSLG